jgi:NADH-quinone oxidoreductase subunit G/[NiFe] hydrogenase diaphorase moiety small subunit
MTAEMITITIDGKELKVRPGTTVLEAAQKAGIHIPTLCHHDDLCAQALYSQSDAKGNDSANKHAESGMLATPSSCRMCLVEVEGVRTLQASCAVPIHSAMTVRTTSTAIRHARRDILELMMSEHYGAEVVRRLRRDLRTLRPAERTAVRDGRPEQHYHA